MRAFDVGAAQVRGANAKDIRWRYLAGAAVVS